jgi:hypothetical protein
MPYLICIAEWLDGGWLGASTAGRINRIDIIRVSHPYDSERGWSSVSLACTEHLQHNKRYRETQFETKRPVFAAACESALVYFKVPTTNKPVAEKT